MRDIIEEIWATARRNKLRTTLTGFSVAWGIFMLIFLLGAGNGLIHGVTANADRFLSNSMLVGGGATSKAYQGLKEGRPITLNDKDIATTEHRYASNVTSMGAEIQQSAIIAYDNNYVSSTLHGCYPNEAVINKIEVLSGRFINNFDLQQNRKVLVLAQNQAKELCPENFRNVLGQFVKVGDLAFEVVGITKTDQSSMSTDAYTPFTTLRLMYGRGDKADNILFAFQGLDTKEDNEAFEKNYKQDLNANHQAAPDDEDAVWIWNRFTQAMQMNMGMDIIRKALWVVGILTLLSGIVGVSNIMLISVKERTREFGIRKAIGAKPASILRLIIAESIIITTFFGYIGMLCGIAANQYMDSTAGQQTVDMGFGQQMQTFLDPTVGIDVCIEATLVMIIAGTLAGLIPARRAARVRPIEALRAE